MPATSRKRGRGGTPKEDFPTKKQEEEEEFEESEEEEEEEELEESDEEEEDEEDDEDEEEEEEEEDDEEEESDEEEEEEEEYDDGEEEEEFVEEEEKEEEEGGEEVEEEEDDQEEENAVAFELSSDEEVDIENMNTVGNVPMEWYEDYDHVGYNLKGEKIMKSQETKDALDQFLHREENPSAHWRTVYDEKNQKDVVLSKKDMQMLLRVGGGQYPNKEFDPYFDAIDPEVVNDIHPVTNTPEPKRRFVPSKWEARRVGYLVKAIRNGWIDLDKKPKDENKPYLIWKDDDNAAERKRKGAQHIAAPKMKLPGHAESYNPPQEYLLTEEEEKEMLEKDPLDRPFNFVPRKYQALRHVPAYEAVFKERFERCLDLYMCPRTIKLKQRVNPKDLLPKLPPKSELRPFPNMMGVKYAGHTKMVRSLSVHSKGQYLATGSDDHTVRIWEVSTGRCMRIINVGGVVEQVSWCPREDVMICAVAVKKRVFLINCSIGSKTSQAYTQAAFTPSEFEVRKEKAITTETETNEQQKLAHWTRLVPVSSTLTEEEKEEREKEKEKEREEAEKEGFVVDGKEVEAEGVGILHRASVKSVVWHWKGDYFSSVIEGDHKQVLIHRLSTHKTQAPFAGLKGLVQCVNFHPVKPWFFVVTQQFIRIYNLAQPELVKKVAAAVKWASSVAIHPFGDNVIIGSYDKKVCWFDVELSSKPYKILRYHNRAVRSVTFHKKYPLWSSSSDDGKVHVFHGSVFPDDYSKDPMIVPLKILSSHSIHDGFGVMGVEFHPQQPWLFSCGGDGNAFMYV